jgi:glycosyltransferase involved in cell wall biosynthesis
MHLPDIGGPARSHYRQLEALAAEGELQVLVPEEGDVSRLYSSIGATAELPFGPITFPSGPRDLMALGARTTREVATVRERLRRFRPDLVVLATATLPAALTAARLEGVPTIVCAGEIFDKGPARSLAGRALGRFTASTASAVVCCSNRVRQQFPRRAEIPVVTIYPGIAPGYADGDRSAFRRQHGIPSSALCVAVVGSLTAGRGQELAIRALALLRKDVPDAHLLVVGLPHPRPVDRAYAERLPRLAEALGVADATRFTGFVSEVADVYAAADVVVNPARVSEGFGRVALEALVARRPVVAARVGATEEVLRADEDALLVEPEDVAAIAAAVERLWRDRALRERLVERGSARIARDFSERAGVEAFLNVAGDVLRARAEPLRPGRARPRAG